MLPENTFRGGLAVSLSVRITGGVEYHQANRSAAVASDGAKIESWDTRKVTRNPEEHARAVKARADIRNAITKLCSRTPLGDLLLVPPDRETQIRESLEAARAKVEAYNATATAHFLTIGCVLTRFEPSDTASASSIRGEILTTLAQMESGIASGDVDAIRDAATAARQILPMLRADAAAYLEAAIAYARDAARKIGVAAEKGRDMLDTIAGIQGESAPLDLARVEFSQGDARKADGERAAS